MWGLAPVNGVFREVSGNGIGSPDGEVSGTVTVNAASVEPGNTRHDTPALREVIESSTIPTAPARRTVAGPPSGVAVPRADRARPGPPAVLRCRGVRPGNGEVWLDAEVHVNRADFGLTWNQMGWPR